MLNIEAENDYVIVEQIKVNTSVSDGGIVMAEVVKYADTIKGKVIKVSKHSEYPMTVSEGDIVYFTETLVKSHFHLDGKEYLVIPEKDILGYEPQESSMS